MKNAIVILICIGLIIPPHIGAQDITKEDQTTFKQKLQQRFDTIKKHQMDVSEDED